MNCSNPYKKCFLIVLCFSFIFLCNPGIVQAQPDIGVIFVIHGGMEVYKPEQLWDDFFTPGLLKKFMLGE